VDEVMGILLANEDKSFVKRILRPDKYPYIKNSDGSHSTHLMSWSGIEKDGKKKYVVYPSILYDGKQLRDYGDDAFDLAIKSGNYIEFDSPEKADWFSKRYKSIWGE